MDSKNLIDREAAIEAVKSLPDCANGFSDTYDKARIISVLENVPSARPTGEWQDGDWIYSTDGESVMCEWICSQCGAWTFEKTRFCSNCGAKMEVEHEL